MPTGTSTLEGIRSTQESCDISRVVEVAVVLSVKRNPHELKGCNHFQSLDPALFGEGVFQLPVRHGSTRIVKVMMDKVPRELTSVVLCPPVSEG